MCHPISAFAQIRAVKSPFCQKLAYLYRTSDFHDAAPSQTRQSPNYDRVVRSEVKGMPLGNF